MSHLHDDAVEFLRLLRRGGPWILTAIKPDENGKIETITAKTDNDVRTFLSKYDGIRNLYYSVNPTRKAMTSKAAKTDIAAVEYLLADLDPKKDETPEAAKTRFLSALDELKPEPTAIIDSGNGIQVLLKLAEPIILAEPMIATNAEGKSERAFPAETAALITDVEKRVKTLMETLGSVAGTQNIDRILRLPGTVNLPTKAKIKMGRTACQSSLLAFNELAVCKLEDFPKPSSDRKDDSSSHSTGNAGDRTGTGFDSTGEISIDWTVVEQHIGWLKGVADLPADFSAKGKAIIAHSGNLKELNFELQHAQVLAKPYQSWSEVALALTAIFKHDSRYSNEQIAAALLTHLECNQHIRRQPNQRRTIERLILRSHELPPGKMRKAGAPNWREQTKEGAPKPSMHNARIAIVALGIECSYDTFHSKLLFGFKDDSARHTVEHIVGEVSDNGIIALRQRMSDTFGFDLTDRHTRDAVISLALDHCFDPIVDMLALAEANWDGVKRLDRMAADYFNCEDNKLNAAFIRKTMIAAVARARIPGIKFDNITVLESDEGYNKSSAWRVLAGDENFSDERIIGKESREVQEQLSAIWIHENADLAGLKKAEVRQGLRKPNIRPCPTSIRTLSGKSATALN